MPRPRKYTTDEEQRDAARERSRKYYERNAEAIRERKKKERALKKENLDSETVTSIVNEPDFQSWMFREDPDDNYNLDSSIKWDEWDPMYCLYRVQALIEHEFGRAGSDGYHYMETLYRTVSMYLSNNGSMNTTDYPLMISQMRFEYFLKQAEYQELCIGQEYGYTSDSYSLAKEMVERILYLISCLDDLALSARRGRFDREYRSRKYQFQAEWMHQYFVYKPL
ncbi:hypothetical protein V5O48_013064 [Marasmius crinis-equi]|uniref:Uncharacterized protein n=1 Tax=Marasmius crinis-equi TaxID=585013 RepID=A0ABR3F133_9AGAR